MSLRVLAMAMRSSYRMPMWFTRSSISGDMKPGSTRTKEENGSSSMGEPTVVSDLISAHREVVSGDAR